MGVEKALQVVSPRPPSDQSPSPLQSHTGSPTDFLKGVVGKRVIVRLLSGVDYRGLICAIRFRMAMVLSRTGTLYLCSRTSGGYSVPISFNYCPCP